MDNIADRQQRYDDNYRTDSKLPTGKGFPLIVLLFIAGVAAYAFNFGGFRSTTTNPNTSTLFSDPTPTICPTLYNGPQSIIEDGRLKLITPTPHPCQAGQLPSNETIQEPTISPLPLEE